MDKDDKEFCLHWVRAIKKELEHIVFLLTAIAFMAGFFLYNYLKHLS
jgi:hypothetical protein